MENGKMETAAAKKLIEIERKGMSSKLTERIYKWADGSLCIDFRDNSFLYRPADCEDWKIGSYDDMDNFETYEEFCL